MSRAGWVLLYYAALRHLPPVQEALGLKKRDKPTREELCGEIDAIKVGWGEGEGEGEERERRGEGEGAVGSEPPARPPALQQQHASAYGNRRQALAAD